MAHPRVKCPKCGRYLDASGEMSIDGKRPRPVYQCDECLVTREALGMKAEVALTFCVDTAGRAFDPANPDEPLLPKS